MKSRAQILICFFIVSSWAIQAQQQKELQGRVTAQGKDVTGVVVRNMNSQKATITDEKGNFTITAEQNDTLVFLAVQFKNKTIVLTPEVFNTNFMTVPLEEFVNELSEVVVSPYNLSGDIDKDIQNLKLEKDVSAETLGLPNAKQQIPTQSQRKLQQATAGKFNVGMILNPPLDPIINAITGRTKMLKNRVKVDKKYRQTQAVQTSFENRFFIEVLKIPEEKIDDFMYFCEVDTSFQEIIETEDQLKIWEFLRLKSGAYLKNNQLD